MEQQYKYNCIHGGGEYHGYVFAEGGETVFEVHYPMFHYDEDLGEKIEELTLFDLGIMKNTLDVLGLQNHLIKLGKIAPDAVVVMDSQKADKGAVIESITGGVHSAVNPVVGYADGGNVKWQNADTGDSALVKSENKMGVIMKAYGRKFHLKFVDGTEKTYDADELTFFEDEKMKMGGKTKNFKDMTFKEKSASIQAKLRGSKVSPKYRKKYGKTYDSKEAKEAANAITGKIVSKMKE